MLQLRPKEDRGHTWRDWLDSYHTFSWGEYNEEPTWTGFSDLLAINDETIKPGGSFEPHSHQNVEILTYVLQGTLAHKDSLGNGSLLRPGRIQRISAGAGILHCEFNPSDVESVHYLQIWIRPDLQDLAPDYEEAGFQRSEIQGRWRLLASRHGAARDGSRMAVAIHQDISVYTAILSYGGELEYPLPVDRAAWVQIIGGVAQVNGRIMEAGDGAAVLDEPLTLEGVSNEAEVLLFDLRRPPA